MKVLVEIIESERGWGQKVAYTETFKTIKGAKAFVTRFNAKNNKKTVPDWYQYARLVSIDGVAVA